MIPESQHFKRTIAPLILRGFIPPEVCKETIELNVENKERTNLAPHGERGKAVENPSYRNNKQIIDPQWGRLLEYFDPGVLRSAINNHWKTNFRYRYISEMIPLFAKFSAGEYCRLHYDVIFDKETNKLLRSSRRLSALAYLSAWHYLEGVPGTFTGGELVFPALVDELGNRLSIQPGLGDIIIFPSNPNYPHLVPQVTSGTRYTVVSFYALA